MVAAAPKGKQGKCEQQLGRVSRNLNTIKQATSETTKQSKTKQTVTPAMPTERVSVGQYSNGLHFQQEPHATQAPSTLQKLPFSNNTFNSNTFNVACNYFTYPSKNNKNER